MAFIELLVDDLQVDGVTPPNGGFELGDLTNWDYFCPGEQYQVTISQDSHSGDYAGYIEFESQTGNDFIGLAYVDPPLSGTSSVSIWFNIPYCDYNETDRIKIYITAYFPEYEEDIYLYNFDSNEDTLTQNEWINASADISSFSGEYFVVVINIELYKKFILYIDDITTHTSSWEGFANGDFESGLDNWNTYGEVSIDNIIVHGGNNSCKLSGEHGISHINQDIDLTDYKQLNIYYNITQCNNIVTFELISESTPVRSQIINSTTDGWNKLIYDVSDLNGIYIIKISATSSNVYIDDITLQEEYDVTSYITNFNNSSWFNYISNLSHEISTWVSNEGIDNSGCAYLYTGYNLGNTTKSGIYYYFDLTDIEQISLLYRSPSFKTYRNENTGSFNIKINDTKFTIANATYNGTIPDWTQYIVDVSEFSGICKVEIYGESYYGNYPPPDLKIYVDNVKFYLRPINISQQLYLRHQYDYETRALDNGLIVDNNLQYSHRLTDKGQFIDFDYVDMPSKGFLRKIKYILNTLYMRIRGIM